MAVASRWMIGFGILLFACAAIGWTRSAGTGVRSGLPMGLALIASGAAAAQGRRSLRRTGGFFGTFLPMIAVVIYGWHALEGYRAIGTASSRPLATILLTIMALAGLATLGVLLKLRVGDNIAERGYSIAPQGEAARRGSTKTPRPEEVDSREPGSG